MNSATDAFLKFYWDLEQLFNSTIKRVLLFGPSQFDRENVEIEVIIPDADIMWTILI